MNKKWILPIVVLGLLVVGVGAVLVNHLSDKVTADIVVTSPMETGISLGEGKDWDGESYPAELHDLEDWTIDDTPLEIPVMYGGETMTLYIMSANLADAEISGFEEAIVSNIEGVTCADFESIIVRVDSIYGDLGYGTPQDVIDLGACFEFETGVDAYVKIGSPGNSLWGVGETDVSEIVVTFQPNAEGTYTFTYQVIPAVE